MEPEKHGMHSGVGIVVDPAVGAVFMSLSTILVEINSQILRR